MVVVVEGGVGPWESAPSSPEAELSWEAKKAR